MYQLRKYQELAIEFGLRSLKTDKKEILMLPTASGKSLVASGLCRQLNDTTVILQPTKEILVQNYNKLSIYGIDDIAMYSASMNKKETAKYTYATIGSIKDYEVFNGFKYCIMDECHYLASKGMYRNFFKAHPKMKVIGMSATPYRMETVFTTKFNRETKEMDLYSNLMLELLHQIPSAFFKGFSFKVNIQRLIDEGYLAPITYLYPDEIEVEDLPMNTSGTDYDDYVMEEYLNSTENITKVVNCIIQNNHLKNNLIFCSSIEHARNCAELLAKSGYDSEVITGKDKSSDRDRKIQDFSSGKIKHMFNVGVLTTGYDYPGLYGVTLGRPVTSLGLLYQMIGRGLRIDPLNPNKRCTVIDPCRNTMRVGRVETIKIVREGNRDYIVTEAGVLSGKVLMTREIIRNK